MPTPPPRDRALDGLRGVAALVVLAGHLLVSTVTPLANGILSVGTTDVSAPAWALLYTPLHVFWAGTEAVTVFFVLSGYVLSLPVGVGAAVPAGVVLPAPAAAPVRAGLGGAVPGGTRARGGGGSRAVRGPGGSTPIRARSAPFR